MEKILKALERAQNENAHAANAHAADLSPDQFGGAAHQLHPETFVARRPVVRTRVEPTSEATLAANRLVAGTGRHKLGDTFRVLRTRVLQRMEDSRFSTLMVVSPNAGEGKSVLAANLALSIARLEGRHVLLVDIDLRRPAVQTLFGVGGTPGLADYLRDDAELEDCLVSPGIDRLVLLPAGAPTAESSDLLAGPRMQALTAELKSRYPDRIVIYDAPPLFASDDVITFGDYVDCGLFVAAEGQTPVSDIEESLALLAHVPLLGSVLNKSRAETRSYYGQSHS